ncbi:MAG: T9SS type A sorting domain-containing protein, partial [Caldithrix sp.]|nr:T9SS type A sorting domain-containing protein [Caldithrix sp.]
YTNNKIIVTTKYDKKGNLQWVRKYGQESNYLRYVTGGCEVDVAGNVYVSGNYYNENNRDSKFIVIKYDSTGEQIWVAEFISPVNSYLSLRKMAMDTAHNIYLIGSINSFNVSNYDYAIVKFDTSGNLLYSDFYGVVERDETTTVIALDNKNNVYITGDSYSNGQKVVTIKYKQKPVTIEPVKRLTPKGTELFQNYPNPFNSTTTISLTIPKTMPVNLKIFNLLGKEIKTLLNGQLQAGKHEFVFDAENLASGIYIYRLQIDTPSAAYVKTKKMLYLK